jgi:hypothetical protein
MSPSQALPDLTGEAVSFNLSEPLFASVAQSVEQLIRNQQVGGSIPLAGSNDFFQAFRAPDPMAEVRILSGAQSDLSLTFLTDGDILKS